MTLTTEQIYVVWAAMQAMVNEQHSPQDNLNLDQWEAAQELLAELNRLVDGE